MLQKVRNFEKEMITKLGSREINFSAGDTVAVGVRIIDGNNERVQEFQGICIAIRRKGLMTNFVLRKVSDDVIVERMIMLHSPVVSYINVTRRGKVNRAKLYYLRNRRGKSARIAEKKTNNAGK